MTPDQIPADLRETIEQIVDYNWADELAHYREMCKDGEDVSDHVFVHLVTLKNFVDGTAVPADEFVPPAGEAGETSGLAFDSHTQILTKDGWTMVDRGESVTAARRPVVHVDFQNADEHGRVRLNTVGTVDSLARGNVQLLTGLRVTLTDGEVETTGVVMLSAAEGIFVAAPDRAATSVEQAEALPPPSSVVPTFLVDFRVADDRGRTPISVFKRLDSMKFGDFILYSGLTVNLSDGEVTVPGRVEEVTHADGGESDWVAVPFGHR